MKRIVICADGTWNRPEQDGKDDAPTNVLKVARAISPNANGHKQVVFYDWGVGSYYDPVMGGGFGSGINKNIQDAYRFIVQNYDPGDELYFFGFSRGAYTVRSLAGFIRNCGILRRTHASLIHAAFELYRGRGDPPSSATAARFRKKCSVPHAVRIKFIGVWDTVGALGVPVSMLGFLNEQHLFHDVAISSIVEHARHAMSIDETRDDFAPTRWRPKAGVDMKQVWFAGVHADVGGGYPQEKRDKGLLSKLPLSWMLTEAEDVGLGLEAHLKKDIDKDKRTCHLATAHNEHEKLKWRFLGTKHRSLRKSDYIHISVQARYRELQDYRPDALKKFLKAQGWKRTNQWQRVIS